MIDGRSEIERCESGKEPVVWFHSDPTKSNSRCVYCGRPTEGDASRETNKEHLIGRNFVPKGTLGGDGRFNFIFRSCKKCNSEKADIERHVSSLTLFNSPACMDDPSAKKAAVRKANRDYHPAKRGVRVKDSSESFPLKCQYGPLTFNFICMPQPQLHRPHVVNLAFRHVQGLFAIVTAKSPKGENYRVLRPSNFYFHNAYISNDWGNPHLVEVEKRTRKWEIVASVNTAERYFKAVLRKRSTKPEEWFWALEWNKQLRVIGALIDEGLSPRAFDDLPDQGWRKGGTSDGKEMAFRSETPLSSDDDNLFPPIIDSQEPPKLRKSRQ